MVFGTTAHASSQSENYRNRRNGGIKGLVAGLARRLGGGRWFKQRWETELGARLDQGRLGVDDCLMALSKTGLVIRGWLFKPAANSELARTQVDLSAIDLGKNGVRNKGGDTRNSNSIEADF